MGEGGFISNSHKSLCTRPIECVMLFPTFMVQILDLLSICLSTQNLAFLSGGSGYFQQVCFSIMKWSTWSNQGPKPAYNVILPSVPPHTWTVAPRQKLRDSKSAYHVTVRIWTQISSAILSLKNGLLVWGTRGSQNVSGQCEISDSSISIYFLFHNGSVLLFPPPTEKKFRVFCDITGQSPVA